MIRPNEIRTTTIAAAIVIIAATTVMISTAVAIRTAIGIKTAIGIGIKTAIASIRTETVIVTMTRITTAIIARTAAEDLTAETASGAVVCRRRIRADSTATTRAGSAIAELTTKARPRAWTDGCGTFTRITGFQTTFRSTRLRPRERVQSWRTNKRTQAAFGRSRETWTSFSRLSDVFSACPHTAVTSVVLWLPVPREIRTDCINTTSSWMSVCYRYNI